LCNACVNLMINVDQQHIVPTQTQNKSDNVHNFRVAMRLCKFCWREKAICSMISDCVSVAISNQHSKLKPSIILLCVLCLAEPHSSYKEIKVNIFRREFTESKMRFFFFFFFFCQRIRLETFIFLKRIQRGVINLSSTFLKVSPNRYSFQILIQA
jgi:hypothetical protein